MRNLVRLMILSIAVASCATTTLEQSWKDPAFAGPKFQQVLVLGVSKSESNRRIFEDAFVGALNAAGTKGAQSYNVLPVSGPISDVQLAEAIKKTGSDSALVTRVLRVEKDVNVHPGHVSPGFYHRGFGGWYGGAWAVGDVTVQDVLTIESTLWNAKVANPVWSGTSEVYAPKSVAEETQKLAKVLIEKLKADGMI